MNTANVLLLRNSLQLRARADITRSELLSLVAAKLLESSADAVRCNNTSEHTRVGAQGRVRRCRVFSSLPSNRASPHARPVSVAHSRRRPTAAVVVALQG